MRAHSACEHKSTVSYHGGPPEALFKQLQGTMDSRMTGKPGVVSPMENLRPDRVGNKQTVVRTVTWIWVGYELWEGSLRGPREVDHSRGVTGHWCGHTTVASDKSLVEVSKTQKLLELLNPDVKTGSV